MRHSMVVIGGNDESQTLGDVALLKLPSWEWEIPDVTGYTVPALLCYAVTDTSHAGVLSLALVMLRVLWKVLASSSMGEFFRGVMKSSTFLA